MFNKKVSVLTTILACLLVATVTVVGCYFLAPYNKLSRKVNEVTNIINNNFYGEINEEDMDKAVFSALVASLKDKYGSYYAVSDAESYLDTYEKESEGLGISYIIKENGNILVVSVHANSPADKGGVKLYDEIIGVDNLTIKQDGARKLLEYIGEKSHDEEVKLKLLRNNKEISLTVICGLFEKQTVYYEKIENIGYIKVTHFDKSTLGGFKLALNNLKAQNVKALLFDIRSNSGGTVNAVCDVLDLLLPECDLISVQYKDGEKRVLRSSDKKCETLPMAVLTNSLTASASELFTTAIREINNGKIIGEKTFGKGQIQTIFNLTDGSILKITVGKFYSPLGNNWDKVGVEPDIEVKLTKEQQENLYLLTTKNDPVIKKGVESLK